MRPRQAVGATAKGQKLCRSYGVRGSGQNRFHPGVAELLGVFSWALFRMRRKYLCCSTEQRNTPLPAVSAEFRIVVALAMVSQQMAHPAPGKLLRRWVGQEANRAFIVPHAAGRQAGEEGRTVGRITSRLSQITRRAAIVHVADQASTPWCLRSCPAVPRSVKGSPCRRQSSITLAADRPAVKAVYR